MDTQISCSSPEVVDLLPANPSEIPFRQRVRSLGLSNSLIEKIERTQLHLECQESIDRETVVLTRDEEKELATEVLLLRHRFTECVAINSFFRQAALTIIQNIYLFKNRKIFFNCTAGTPEQERQEALSLLGTSSISSIPLRYTFQHLIIARTWQRVLAQLTSSESESTHFAELHQIVVQLNTLRNIYIIMTAGLVRKLAAQLGDIYKQSVTYEDAVQIGSIGVARAAYRYHPSSEVRFSTFASKWVFSEIQRQALKGRLIRISANSVELLSRALKSGDSDGIEKHMGVIQSRTLKFDDHNASFVPVADNTLNPVDIPERSLEQEELSTHLTTAISKILSKKTADIIRRRYGLPPYTGNPQSIISISKEYGVTRSNIYQLESKALQKLRKHLNEFC